MLRSSRQLKSWTNVRSWEKHHSTWDKAKERGVTGSLLLARQRGSKRLYPVSLDRCVPRRSERVAFGWSSHATRAVVGWVAMAWKLKRRVLVCRQLDLATLSGCSPRTISTAIQQAVDSGLVQRRHHYCRARIGSKVHLTQLTSSYRPTRKLLAMLDGTADPASSEGRNGCDPTEKTALRRNNDEEKESCSQTEHDEIEAPTAPAKTGRSNVRARFDGYFRLTELALRLGPPGKGDQIALDAMCPGLGVRGHTGCAICGADPLPGGPDAQR